MTFQELGLSANVLRAVSDAGYDTPTPIQAQAIPLVLAGHDLIGCAQTGTGKTAGFVLPMIDRLAAGRAKARMPRSLILEPTRELAAQVEESFAKYSKYHKLSTALIVGGVSADDQLTKLSRGVDVLIATPGRLLDLYERGAILMTDVRILILDECDRMLDMGFIPDVEKIASLLRPDRQTLLFSATMPPEIRHLAKRFLTHPLEVHVAPPASPAANVEQAIVRTASHGKRDALRAIMASETVTSALIFCNRKRDVDILWRSLQKHGFNVGRLHGDMDQGTRTETLDGFKEGKVNLLVCSDVAARGIDIKGLSHVFNFDVPTHAEDYIHRIGRTGRAGLPGKSFTLVTSEEKKFLDAIEALIGAPIPEKKPEGVMAPDAASGDIPERHGRFGRDRHGRDRNGRRGRPERHDRPAETAAPHPAAETPAAGTPAAELSVMETAAATEIQAEPPMVHAEAVPPAPAPAPQQEIDPQQRQRDMRRHGERHPREGRDNSRRDNNRPPRGEGGHDRRGGRDGQRRDEPRNPSGPRPEGGHPHAHDNRRNDSRDRRPRHDRDDDNMPPVKGFGNNIPAFLRHPRKA